MLQKKDMVLLNLHVTGVLNINRSAYTIVITDPAFSVAQHVKTELQHKTQFYTEALSNEINKIITAYE